MWCMYAFSNSRFRMPSFAARERSEMYMLLGVGGESEMWILRWDICLPRLVLLDRS